MVLSTLLLGNTWNIDNVRKDTKDGWLYLSAYCTMNNAQFSCDVIITGTQMRWKVIQSTTHLTMSDAIIQREDYFIHFRNAEWRWYIRPSWVIIERTFTNHSKWVTIYWLLYIQIIILEIGRWALNNRGN